MTEVVVSSLINEEIIFLDLYAETSEELLTIVGNRLFRLGYVKQSYIPAVVAREKEFPTGLALEDFNVAIPHTDYIHIENPFIAVVKNFKEIPFIHMGTDDQEIGIDYFFFLGIKEPGGQVQMLQTLMESFNDKEFVETIRNTIGVKELHSYLSTKL